MELLQVAGSLGVGAFLGTLIFVMYRHDRQASELRLSNLLQADQTTRQEHSRVISELVTLLRSLNGRLK